MSKINYYVFRNKSSFHKIEAKNEEEAKLLLIARKNTSFFYYKLVGIFPAKNLANKYIKSTKNKGYINQDNTLVNNKNIEKER